MSRIGKLPIAIPSGVEVKVGADVVEVKGAKTTLTTPVCDLLSYEVADGHVTLTRKVETRESRSQHGLRRTLLANCIEGVTKGFSKELEVNGVGYRVAKQGKQLVMNLGYSHQVTVEEKDGVKQLFYRGIPVDAAVPKVMTNTDGTKVTLDGAAATTYVRDGIDKVEASEVDALPALEVDANGDPITIGGTDGNVYYVKQGTLANKVTEEDLRNQVAAATGLTGEALEEALEEEKAKYVETSEFKPPLDDNVLSYYPKDDLVLKDEYDKVNDSVMRDENGDPYSFTVDGTKYYAAADQKDPFVTEEAYEQACEDAEKLEYLANEKRFVDIGLGLQEDENGKLIESSAFNECLSGLTFLGYGMDDDGDPKNIYSIVQRLKDIAAGVPEGEDWDTPTWEEFDRLVGKLENASSEYKTQFTNQSAGTEKLKNNYDLLEDNIYNLKEQYSNLEDVNMADAISSFLWAEYCYNAALKVGNSILSQSLMDYLQ